MSWTSGPGRANYHCDLDILALHFPGGITLAHSIYDLSATEGGQCHVLSRSLRGGRLARGDCAGTASHFMDSYVGRSYGHATFDLWRALPSRKSILMVPPLQPLLRINLPMKLHSSVKKSQSSATGSCILRSHHQSHLARHRPD